MSVTHIFMKHFMIVYRLAMTRRMACFLVRSLCASEALI